MDLVKNIYDVLNLHFGETHWGLKRLGPEYDVLKKDIYNLVLSASVMGELRGAKRVIEAIDNSNTDFEHNASIMVDQVSQSVRESQDQVRSIFTREDDKDPVEES